MNHPHYKNFSVAIYTRVYEVNLMSDLNYLKRNFEIMSRQVKVNKVYLETHRDMIVADEVTLRQAKTYLESLGVQVSGGITLTVNERNRFQTYCYTNPDHRQKLKDLSAYTARLFDEFILDDFFFTNCKCPDCIAAKGNRSWTEFRLELMNQAAEELVLAPARSANPKVKVIIKYPNWYEHFQGLGFDLSDGPRLFDGIYTGTETRDPHLSNQHLQPYESYLVFRYFENIKPGGNLGGWVDPFGSHSLDRYAEQLWLTLFAKAPEVTLFDFRSLQMPIQESQRGAWQGQGSSFDFDAVTAPARDAAGNLRPDAFLTLAAGAAFVLVDPLLGQLGNPVGLKAYKPYHSHGEDFLHNTLGMLGIPIELVPKFPTEARTVLLTESCKFDHEIVEKIKTQLIDGKDVVITSGLLRALQDSGLQQIVELEVTDRKMSVQEFLIGWFQVASASQPILVPVIQYYTNDSWEEISCLGSASGTPLLHSAIYGAGRLYVLTIPDDFSDLYALPLQVLSRIKESLTKDLYVRLEAPANVALFTYDNDCFLVESFLDQPIEGRIVLDEIYPGIENLLSHAITTGEPLLDWRGQKTGKKAYPFTLQAHSFVGFKALTR